jgi:hypothetical protein
MSGGGLRAALLASLLLLALGPAETGWLSHEFGMPFVDLHDAVAAAALIFTGLVTALVARHVFGPGRVTAHRIQGAVLLYLNAAAMFAIGYGIIAGHLPDALLAAGKMLPAAPGHERDAHLFEPLARSLANLEAVFGQLFPATLLARLVGLHLSSSRRPEA